MQAILISKANIEKILAASSVDSNDTDVMEEFFDTFERYFIKDLTDNRKGEPTDHWASVPVETLERYFDLGKGDITSEWVDVTRKELDKYLAIEIKSPWAATIARRLVPDVEDYHYEHLKGCFVVLDYPEQGRHGLVNPEFWDSSDFTYIENGPVIRLKKFTRKDEI